MVGHREGELQPGNQQRVFQDLSSCGFRDQAPPGRRLITSDKFPG
jgi:hypothetical protein